MSKVLYDSRILKVELCEECADPGHPAMVVISKDDGVTIGAIKWNARTSEYCLYPRPKTGWNWDALYYALAFMTDELCRQLFKSLKGAPE